jgi:hypothetical protein
MHEELVDRRHSTGSREPGTADGKHGRGAPRDLFSLSERRQILTCRSRTRKPAGETNKGAHRCNQNHISSRLPATYCPLHSTLSSTSVWHGLIVNVDVTTVQPLPAQNVLRRPAGRAFARDQRPSTRAGVVGRIPHGRSLMSWAHACMARDRHLTRTTS